MPVASNICEECGVPLALGLAVCPSCGARTGTLFSETGEKPNLPKFSSKPKSDPFDLRYQLEKARDGANNSIYLALASFLPVLGLPLGVIAIVLGARAQRML